MKVARKSYVECEILLKAAFFRGIDDAVNLVDDRTHVAPGFIENELNEESLVIYLSLSRTLYTRLDRDELNASTDETILSTSSSTLPFLDIRCAG